MQYAAPPVQYAAPPVQYAAAPVQYAAAPVQYGQPVQYAAAPVQYAVQPRVDPMLAQLHQRLTQFLQDPKTLKQVVKECWVAVVGNDSAPLDMGGLQRLCQQVQARTGLPPQAFGALPDTFMRYDFNGNGSLDPTEGYRCVKSCMREFRKQTGGDPPANVPMKSPNEAGYEVIKVLAAGGQGEASLCRKIATGEELVLKSYNRDNENAGGIDELLDEADHMQAVSKCPNVAHCLDVFQDQRFFYMVSGANMGGDWSKIKVKAQQAGVQMTEDWYRNIFKQGLEGLAFMHSHAIMHCDLKEPNLMLKDSNYANPTVVIIDLGLSQAMNTDSAGPCGTPGYIPPETWQGGKWFPRGDVFSYGVVCCQILTDKIPDEKTGAAGIFSEGCMTMDDVIGATSTRPPPLHLLQVQNPACQQWIAACLQKAIQGRPRAPQVLQMPWFVGQPQILPQMPQMTYAAPRPVQYASAPVSYAAPPAYAAAPVTYAAPPAYAAAPVTYASPCMFR